MYEHVHKRFWYTFFMPLRTFADKLLRTNLCIRAFGNRRRLVRGALGPRLGGAAVGWCVSRWRWCGAGDTLADRDFGSEVRCVRGGDCGHVSFTLLLSRDIFFYGDASHSHQ